MLQGAGLGNYYGGLTQVLGEPREEFEKGVEYEHCSCSDSTEEFTTSNYGVTTTPHIEFNLVANGGEGLESRMVTMADGSEL